jgi:hypothetical protein
MITEAPYPENLKPALASASNQPARTSPWPQRWMIHRPDGSFARYLVNWEIGSGGNCQPSLLRIPELKVPQVETGFISPEPEKPSRRFLKGLRQ